MVFAPPRPDEVSAARLRVEHATPAYLAAMDTLPDPVRQAIGAYVGALCEEAAAHRIRARRTADTLDRLRQERRTR